MRAHDLLRGLVPLFLFVLPAHATTMDVLDETSACTGITNSSAETELYGFDIPGGTISGTYKGVIHQQIIGAWRNFSGAGHNGIVKIKVGGTIVYQQTLSFSSTSVARPWMLDLYLSKQGSGSSNALLHATLNQATITFAPTVGIGQLNGATLVPTVVEGAESFADFSSTQRLAVTFQWDAANSNLSVDCNHGSTTKE